MNSSGWLPFLPAMTWFARVFRHIPVQSVYLTAVRIKRLQVRVLPSAQANTGYTEADQTSLDSPGSHAGSHTERSTHPDVSRIRRGGTGTSVKTAARTAVSRTCACTEVQTSRRWRS
jgi:hypothetical protein